MEEIWSHSISKRVLENALASNKGLDHVTQTVGNNITSLVEEDPVNNCSGIVTCGSRLLGTFCSFNWVGPNQADLSCPYPNSGTNVLNELKVESLEALSCDGEPVYPLCHHPVLLWLAHTLLVENGSLLGPSAVVWTLRCLFVRQKILAQRSASLWSQISHLIEGDIRQMLEASHLSQEKRGELHLELANILLYYSQYQDTKRHVCEAQSCVGLSMELSGALGKRTRFQEKELAQLLLSVSSPRTMAEEEEDGSSGGIKHEEVQRAVPKNVLLQDDTLLERVVYSDPKTTPPPRLTSLEQAVVLGQCVYQLRSLPIDRLGNEEAEAFIQCVLSQPQCWCVQCVALFLRCQTERRRSRRGERAMLQLEELTHSYSATKDDHVLDLFYCLPVPTIWAIEKEYADVLLSMGATKSALEVYERLEMWEEVAECSSAVGRSGRVREVVRERLERGAATPTLLCVLGDVTRDPEDYRRAWEMSGGRCGRAQRSLGYYHLRRKEYKECIPAFQLSLKINSLQEKVWFSLGCAAQQIGDQELAVQAFQRCVSLEADFAEAWNNLATIYLKRKEKVKAFRAFQEAVKCSYDSWKIWENLLVVSVDVGELRQALQAYHRILDLQNKFLDVEILQCFVKSVLKGKEDTSGQSAARLRESVGQLLGRVTSQVTGNADVWELYADYHCSSSDTADQEKGLLELQKAQRCARQVRGWDREWTSLERAAILALKYCTKCREMSLVRNDRSQSAQSLSSAKLALQGVITKTKGFGIVVTEEQEKLVVKLEDEQSHLQSSLAELLTD